MVSRCFLAAVLALTLATPTIAFAAWTTNGNPLCTATGAQLAPSAASDGSGGMIVAWQDRRRGSSLNDIFAVRVLQDGTIAPGWPVDGVPLCQTGLAGVPKAVSDGSGGALVLWLESSGIHAQRVSASGAIAPGFPANGKLVTASTANVVGLDAVSDAAGGAYILSTTLIFNPFVNGLRPAAAILRVTPDAVPAPGWTIDGTSIGFSDVGIVTRLAQAPGGDCVFGVITRIDAQTNPSFASAGRFHAGGTSEVRGLPTYNTTMFPGNNPGPVDISVAPDGAGGLFALKRDSDGQSPPVVFENHGHHYDFGGTASWPQAALVTLLQQPVSDGALGVYLIGTTGSPARLEADYYTSTGAPVWAPGSRVLSQPTAFQNLRTAPLGIGGAGFACWSENPTGSGFDIKAAGVFPLGVIAPGNGSGGGPICNAAGNQLSPDFVLDSGPSGLVCWEDQRSTPDGDIYATRFLLDVATAVQVSLAAVEVRADAVRLRWSVVDPSGAATVLRRTRRSEWTPLGSPEGSAGSLSFEDRTVVAGTEYDYALAFAADPATRLGESWVQVPAYATALAGFVPNPSTGAPRIAFALPGGERAQLEVVDVTGRVVLTREVGSFGAGSHTIDLAGARLAAGIYLMRLTQGGHVHTARGIVVR